MDGFGWVHETEYKLPPLVLTDVLHYLDKKRGKRFLVTVACLCYVYFLFEVEVLIEPLPIETIRSEYIKMVYMLFHNVLIIACGRAELGSS